MNRKQRAYLRAQIEGAIERLCETHEPQRIPFGPTYLILSPPPLPAKGKMALDCGAFEPCEPRNPDVIRAQRSDR